MSYTVSITPEDAEVTDLSMEYGGYHLPVSQVSGAPPVKDEVFLQWRDAGGTLHRARVDIVERLPSPPANGKSYWVDFRITADNRVRIAYQSKSTYDFETNRFVRGDDAWYDLASTTTMLPAEDPRDRPVVRKLVVSKHDRPRFKSKREGDTYMGPNGLFQVDYKDVFGADIEIVEKTKDWPYRFDLPQEIGAAGQISMTAISSLSMGGVVAIGFREIDPSAQGALSAIRRFEEERISRFSGYRQLAYEPEISQVEGSAEEYIQMVLPNQEFSRFNYPFGYEDVGGPLKTVGVGRAYLVRGYLIQVGAILPLPREGMTADEAKEYGLTEMERIMEVISFPSDE